jgi:hypothetical protein
VIERPLDAQQFICLHERIYEANACNRLVIYCSGELQAACRLRFAHDAVIRVYDDAGNVIETHHHMGDFKEW